MQRVCSIISNIYISSDSEIIEEIAEKKRSEFYQTKTGLNYQDMLIETIDKVDII